MPPFAVSNPYLTIPVELKNDTAHGTVRRFACKMHPHKTGVVWVGHRDDCGVKQGTLVERLALVAPWDHDVSYQHVCVSCRFEESVYA